MNLIRIVTYARFPVRQGNLPLIPTLAVGITDDEELIYKIGGTHNLTTGNIEISRDIIEQVYARKSDYKNLIFWSADFLETQKSHKETGANTAFL